MNISSLRWNKPPKHIAQTPLKLLSFVLFKNLRATFISTAEHLVHRLIAAPPDYYTLCSISICNKALLQQFFKPNKVCSLLEKVFGYVCKLQCFFHYEGNISVDSLWNATKKRPLLVVLDVLAYSSLAVPSQDLHKRYWRLYDNDSKCLPTLCTYSVHAVK